MKCLRCGHCCKVSMVVIVVDPKLGTIQSNLKAMNLLEEPCPHLRGDKIGEYSCAIHDEPWYHETPCFAHGQMEQSVDNPCRTGEWMLKNHKEVATR